MARIGYHASHEQFPPEELRACAQAAEAAGFRAVMSSEHFAPWSPEQGHSGFGWAWLGSAMQATRLPFGSIAVPGGWRFHPAIVAQATATLARLFPGRLAWLGAGSGEALNEHIVGAGWPPKSERNARLREGVDIIRALWRGETVTRAAPIPTDRARLYTRAERPPAIYIAALSPETAAWAAGWTDGLVTVNQPDDKLCAIVAAFRRHGGDGKPLALQVHVAYAESETQARDDAYRQWRSNVAPADVTEDLMMPEDFAARAASVMPEDLDDHVFISSDLDAHAARLAAYAELGFDEIYVHNVGRNQRQFIATYGERVLPRLTQSARRYGTA